MKLPDIYFLEEYGKVYEDNKEGKLTTYFFECEYGKVYYLFLLRKICIPNDTGYYDITTPFGYGGPLFIEYKEEDLSKLILSFKKEFGKYCLNNNIITEFVRFHPLIKNHLQMDLYMNISNIRDTAYIKLDSPEEIWNNLKSTCRNRIRKAEKHNIEIQLDNSYKSLDNFINLYISTMEINNAKQYYFFDKEFFYNTFKLLKNNVFLFNSIYEGKTISSAMIMKYGDYIHYHFGGSDHLYTNLAPNNLLFYKIALWGQEKGCKYFHLGGGTTGNDDPIFHFKKTFSKDGITNFFIGKKIHNESIYNDIVNEWKIYNNISDTDEINFFPIYRSI